MTVAAQSLGVKEWKHSALCLSGGVWRWTDKLKMRILSRKISCLWGGKTLIAIESERNLLSRVQLFETVWIVHGILQARILEWVAFPFSRASSQHRNWAQVSCTAGRWFTNWAMREATLVLAKYLNMIWWLLWGSNYLNFSSEKAATVICLHTHTHPSITTLDLPPLA